MEDILCVQAISHINDYKFSIIYREAHRLRFLSIIFKETLHKDGDFRFL